MKTLKSLVVGFVIFALGFFLIVVLGFLYSIIFRLKYDFHLALLFGLKNGAICGAIAFLVSLVGSPRSTRQQR